ncbi:MAG TPA: AAA family ATPase [Thermodesulfobacteriota bacterium]|nr:AAA family ATPase [Thermodesulfobacteriota bacterium]
MKTIAIANQKGGCGKTTTAINISAALAATGRRVLLIDLDPQAHASFGLRASSLPTDKSIYYVLTDNPEKRRSLDSCIANVSPNFDIVPSSIQLSTLEQEFKGKEDAVSELYRVLSAYPSTYEYIIIDCPPSLGFLTFNALRAAEQVIVPVDMSAFTLMGVGKLLGMLELIKTKIGHVPRLNALATLFDVRTTYSQSVLGEVKTFFGDQMFQTVIRPNVALKRAVSEGVSIIDFDKTSNGAKDYTALCYEALRLDGVEHPERPIPPSISVQVPERRESVVSLQEEIPKPFELDINEVSFAMEASTAKDIYVAGDFNDWKINDESRLARGENGCWEKRMRLPQGRYRYKFVVDGEWTVDSKNQAREINAFGSFDSVMEIKPSVV